MTQRDRISSAAHDMVVDTPAAAAQVKAGLERSLRLPLASLLPPHTRVALADECGGGGGGGGGSSRSRSARSGTDGTRTPDDALRDEDWPTSEVRRRGRGKK